MAAVVRVRRLVDRRWNTVFARTRTSSGRNDRPVRPDPAPTYQLPFPRRSGNTYIVEWHLFTAGTATLKIESADEEQKVTAIADSSGVANVLYAVHDRFEARFDPKTFCSLGLTKHTEEGSHPRNTQVRFDHPRRKSVLNEKNLKTGEPKQVENDIPPCVTDVVTGFYYLASLPLRPGNFYSFPVNGGKTAEVTRPR
jgi:hypothetical protein